MAIFLLLLLFVFLLTVLFDVQFWIHGLREPEFDVRVCYKDIYRVKSENKRLVILSDLSKFIFLHCYMVLFHCIFFFKPKILFLYTHSNERLTDLPQEQVLANLI